MQPATGTEPAYLHHRNQQPRQAAETFHAYIPALLDQQPTSRLRKVDA